MSGLRCWCKPCVFSKHFIRNTPKMKFHLWGILFNKSKTFTVIHRHSKEFKCCFKFYVSIYKYNIIVLYQKKYRSQFSLSGPTFAVEIAIVDGFGDMVRLYMFRIVEVGNGARNFYNPVVGTCRKIKPLHGIF